MPTVRRCLVSLLLGACALPAGAAANTYCVGDAACVTAGGTDEGGLVQQALDAAAAHPGLDKVQIGSGTFTGTGFSYQDASAGNGVQIVGAGRSLTTLSTTTASSNVLGVQGAVSTIQDLALALPAHDGNTGLSLSGGSTALRIDVKANADATNPTGLDLYTSSTISDLRVALPVGQVGTAIRQRGGGVDLSDAVLDAWRGIDANGSAPSTYRRVKIVNASGGLAANCGSITLEDSSIRLKSGNVAIAALPSPSPGCPGSSVTVKARHVTVTGDGLNAPEAVRATAGAGSTVTFTMRDSILANVTTAIDRQAPGGTVNVAMDYVDLDPANDANLNSSGGTGTITLTHQVNVPPAFVSSTDEHLGASSPLIDAGDPAGLAAGESTKDLGGGPRILDGGAHADCAARQDMGAYEYDPGAVQIATATGPSETTIGTDTPFSASACSPDPGATLSFAWDFGDGGTATGASTSHAFASGGNPTVSVMITDTGGRHAVRTLPLSIPAAPVPPAPGGGDPPAGGGTPPPDGGNPSVQHCRVPKLKGVTPAVARRRLHAAGCRLGKVAHVRRAHRTGPWVVRSSSPKAGTVRPAGTRVKLSLIRRRAA